MIKNLNLLIKINKYDILKMNTKYSCEIEKAKKK